VVTAQVGSYVSGNIKSWSCDYNTVVTVGQRCALIDPLPFQVVVDQDQADVTVAKAQIDLDLATIADKQAVLKAAQVNLAYTNIVSPVNGMVIARYIDIGQTVVSSLQSSTLFLIGRDMRKMQVDTNVSEADVGGVRAGQQAYFTVQNVVTYDVVVDVDNADLALFPGMTADAHIITAEHKNVLRVPLPATRFVPEGTSRRGHDTSDDAERADRRTGRGARGPAARIWLLVNGSLQQVRVQRDWMTAC
jgi:HlyD family secretion protein